MSLRTPKLLYPRAVLQLQCPPSRKGPQGKVTLCSACPHLPSPATSRLPSHSPGGGNPRLAVRKGLSSLLQFSLRWFNLKDLLPLSQNIKIPLDALWCSLPWEPLAPSLGRSLILPFLPQPGGQGSWVLRSQASTSPPPTSMHLLGQTLRAGCQDDSPSVSDVAGCGPAQPPLLGTPWQTSGLDSALSLPRVWVQAPVGELRSLHGQKPKRETTKTEKTAALCPHAKHVEGARGLHELAASRVAVSKMVCRVIGRN